MSDAPPYFAKGRYQNLDGRRIPRGGVGRALRWKLSKSQPPELPEPRDTPARPIAVDPAALVEPGPARVWWLGHATVLLQLDGVNIITDPTVGRIAMGAVKRLAPAPLPVAELPPIHVIAISHNHYDHCDLPTLRALRQANPEAVVVVPSGLDAWMQRRLGGPVVAVPWWGSHSVGSLTVHGVPAQHWSTRGLGDICRSHWCGFVFESRSLTAYFAGDTGFGPHFEAIARRHPHIDLGALPVGAYNPRWFMRDQHMGPQEAVEAARILGLEVLAIHWGTYKLTDEPLDEPPRLAQHTADAHDVRVTVLHPGGWWTPRATHGDWQWPDC